MILLCSRRKDIDIKERTPLKFKTPPTELDSPPVKKSRQQKTRRILDDSSDEENDEKIEEKSLLKQNGHMEEMKQDEERQKDADVVKNEENEGDKDKTKLLEVTSPHNELTLVPKRKTGQ